MEWWIYLFAVWVFLMLFDFDLFTQFSLSRLWGHQYFLISISSTQYTPISNWSNRPLLSGDDSSCSWVFCLCTGPKWWILTHCRRGANVYLPVSIMQILELSTLWSTFGKGHKQAAFHVRFIEKLVLETVTAIQWNVMHKSKHWIVDTQAIANQARMQHIQTSIRQKKKNPEIQESCIVITVSTLH